MTEEQIMVRLRSDCLSLELDNQGMIRSIFDRKGKQEYLVDSSPTPLLRLGVSGRLVGPSRCSYDDFSSEIILSFENSQDAHVAVHAHDTHVSFTLTALTGGAVSHVLWGGFTTAITDTIGETIGVVRNRDFAFGIQSLNVHTIGGRPEEFPGPGKATDTGTSTGNVSEVRAFSSHRDGGLLNSSIPCLGVRHRRPSKPLARSKSKKDCLTRSWTENGAKPGQVPEVPI